MHKNQRRDDQRPDDHQKFRELAALAQASVLTGGERLELENHLQHCAACHEVYGEYALLHSEGMAYLAVAGDQSPKFDGWDPRSVRNELLEKVREADRKGLGLVEGLVETDRSRRASNFVLIRGVTAQWATVAMAACLVVGVAVGAYHLGGRSHLAGQLNPAASGSEGELASQKRASEGFAGRAKDAGDLLASQTTEISRLRARISAEQQDIAGLRTLLRAAQDRSAGLTAAEGK